MNNGNTRPFAGINHMGPANRFRLHQKTVKGGDDVISKIANAIKCLEGPDPSFRTNHKVDIVRTRLAKKTQGSGLRDTRQS
jgi:hypothetical protein